MEKFVHQSIGQIRLLLFHYRRREAAAPLFWFF